MHFWLRKWVLPVFYQDPYALGDCWKRLQNEARIGPKIEAKGQERGGVLGEGTASPTSSEALQ